MENKAINACLDVYMSIHVSELHKYSKPVQRCWKIGQEWRDKHVIKNKRGEE